jgi:hypothetical protein
MSDQSPQRRFQYWAGMLVLLVVLVTVPLALHALQAGRHYQRGVENQCAVHHQADKPDLAGYHWSWWWLPGWVCEFERDGRRWERRLW